MESTTLETKGESSRSSHVPAKNLSRFASSIVDMLIIGVSSAILGALLGSKAAGVLQLIVGAGYYAYFLPKENQTPGMKLVGIKIASEKDTKLDSVKAGLRYVAFSILTALTLGIAPLWALFDKKKQTLYDKIFHTVYYEVDSSKENLSKIIVGCGCALGCLIPVAAIISFGLIGVLMGTKSNSLQDTLNSFMNKNTNQGVMPKTNLPTSNEIKSEDNIYGPADGKYNSINLDTASSTFKIAVNACNMEMKKNKTLASYDFTEFCKCAMDQTLNNNMGQTGAVDYCSDYFPEEVRNLEK